MSPAPFPPPMPATTTARLTVKYLGEKEAAGTISRRTRNCYRGILFDFAGVCPADPSKITRRHVLAWLKTKKSLAPGTRRTYHNCAHGFIDWLRRRRFLHRDPFEDIRPPKLPRPAHRALDTDQVAALIAACETRREHVTLLLALHTGLRRAELAALELGDISLSARSVLVRNGKGGHSRLLPLSHEATRILAGYITSEGITAGPLLRNAIHPEQGLSPQWVGEIMTRLAYRAGVKVRAGDGVGTHSTRHTCATETHRATHDVLVVQALLGHADLSTTQRYISQLDLEGLRAAVQDRTYLTQPTREAAAVNVASPPTVNRSKP